MKIYSWNINGLRAVLNKGALQNFLTAKKPDVLCLQEIKCKPDQCTFDFASLGYDIFYNSAKKPGYSGTAILIRCGIEAAPFETVSRNPYEDFEASGTRDGGMAREWSKKEWQNALSEGRIIVAEFNRFFLVNVYTPNSKPDLSRLELREKIWDPEFLKYLKELEKKKPIITCGDFNAAHEEIDLARPNANHHSAGFTDEERRGIKNLLDMGFIDTFRSQNPDVARYTWWSHWGHARENNVGWRIDYFFISKSLKSHLKSAEIYEHITGSDHCPISIEMEF